MQKNRGSIYYNKKLSNGEVRLVIHPDNILDFEEYLPKLPDIFEDSSNLVYKNSRNKIKRFKKEFQLDKPIIIKRYGQQGLYDNIRFRVSKSRAFRSFRSALLLQELNISIPHPYMAIEYRTTYNKLINSYYVSDYIDFDFDLYEVYHNKPVSMYMVEEIVKSVAQNIKRIHNNNLLYGDLHPNNIHFLLNNENSFRYYLIDFNRIKKIGALSLKKRAKDLCRLRVPEKYLSLFLNSYDYKSAEKLDKYIRKYQKRHLMFKNFKKKIRDRIKLF